jgi:hypothetical protein
MRRIMTIVAMSLMVAQVSFAQTRAATPATPGASEHDVTASEPAHVTAESRPVLDDDPNWTPILLILIGMMFLSAAVIGPIVRLNMPEEIPPAHSHDEPPGTSHHHGAGGTLNPAPETDLHH